MRRAIKMALRYAQHGVLFGASLGCSNAAAPSDWEPLSASALYAEQPREHWASEWGRWAYAQTDCNFVDQDADGSHCADFQPDESPAFFFAGGPPGSHRTRCAVPHGKALVIPLAAFMTDNAGVPEKQQLSEGALAASAQDVYATMTDLQLVVDGTVYSDLQQYAVKPTRFSYELPQEPNWYSCNGTKGVTGLVEPAYITGYFVVLPAPEPGSHEIEYGGVTYFGGVADSSHVKTRFTVGAR
jgi:hypothetical protein